jgi:hypothetical protein
MSRRREDILNLRGSFVPVVFSQKPELNGYYQVSASTANWLKWEDHAMGALPWTIDLLRVGSSFEIDLESKLGGALTRQNNFTVTGDRWHAPAGGHNGYFVSSTIPPFTDRVSTDGTIRVYRTLAGTTPRWTSYEENYGLGRARFLDANGFERVGTSFATTPGSWEVSNSIMRIRPLLSGGVLEVSVWDGTAWRAKNWNMTYAGTTLGVPDAVSVIHNEYEVVTVRLIRTLASVRVTCDITLRRGARFAEIYAQSATAGTFALVLSTAQTGTSGNGFVSATANDANGNRYIVGSTRTFTTDLANGGISLASAVRFDAMVGVVLNGTTPATGDSATSLYAQYIGSPSELVSGVTR